MRIRVSLGAICVIACGSIDCRTATSVTFVITTDAKCADVRGTSITVGLLSELETKPAAAVSTTCDSGGNLGTIVLVPSGKDDDDLAVRVVTGLGKDPDQCVKDGYVGGCIVARRALRYLPHTEVTVPVEMRVSCTDIPCGATLTCALGQCVKPTIDPQDCQSPSGCGEKTLGPAGSSNTETQAEGGADASADASIDASVDAPVDEGVDAPADAIADTLTEPAVDTGHESSSGPPAGTLLLGDNRIEPRTDPHFPGLADASREVAVVSGSVSSLSVWYKGDVTKLLIALYDDVDNYPHQLLGSGAVDTPITRSWNTATLSPPVDVTAGKAYWIALVAPSGSGSEFDFPYASTSTPDITVHSAEANLTAFTQIWTSGGTQFPATRCSFYASQ